MEGLSTIAQYTQTWAQNMKFLKGKELYIGIDGGILMGRPSVIVVGVIMIPIMLVLAAAVPGNRVLPIADLAAHFLVLLVPRGRQGQHFPWNRQCHYPGDCDSADCHRYDQHP